MSNVKAVLESCGCKDLDYLGDGVYVGHDGYHIFLALGDGGPPGRPIGLEPVVFDALMRYRKRVGLAGEEG